MRTVLAPPNAAAWPNGSGIHPDSSMSRRGLLLCAKDLNRLAARRDVGGAEIEGGAREEKWDSVSHPGMPPPQPGDKIGSGIHPR